MDNRPAELPAGVRTGITQADFPAWLAAHGTGIGGSDAAAIMGQSPWGSALGVYVAKTEPARLSDDVGEAALWGRLFEEPMIREYGRRAKRLVKMEGELIRSREFPHLICTLDALQFRIDRPPGAKRFPRRPVGDPGLVEGKTTALGYRYPKPGSDEEIPVEVQIQVQHCLAVTGLTWATVVWLPLPERRLQWRELEPHASFQQILIEQAAEFWQRVQDRNPPPPDGSESANRALAALYSDPNGKTIELSDGELDLQKELTGLTTSRKAMKERQDQIKQDIRALLKDASFGSLPDGSSFSLLETERAGHSCDECGHKEPSISFRVLRHRKAPRKSAKYAERYPRADE